MGCIKYLLVCSNSRILEFALNGPEPIIGIQRLGGLGKGWGIGILEVPKLGSWFFIAIATIVIVVVVVGGNLGEVLESGKVGLAFGVCGFTIL
jgi:hypothetical protein